MMKFASHGSAARQARKILRKRIGSALATVETKHPDAEDIHGAHRDVKKARATLKLLRPALSKAEYTKENDTLRRAGQSLGTVRDAEVLVRTLDHLMEERKGARAVRGVHELRRKLARNAAKLRRRTSGTKAALPGSRKLLRKSRQRVGRWSIGKSGWKKIGKGVRRIYEDASDCLHAIRTEPTVERLHTLRKRTNDLYRQLQLLEPLHPMQMASLVRKLGHLKDTLGDDHDLAVLREAVAMDGSLKKEQSRSQLLTQIERSRTERQRDAMVLADEIYHEEPRAFERRLDDYWRQRRHP